MQQAAISGLNYDAVLGTEDYRTYRQILETEIITRFKMASGFPTQPTQFGIVDVLDPSEVTTSQTNRPLLVKVGSQGALTVQLNPGYAVAPNGTLLQVAALQNKIALADVPLSGKAYVIVLEAELNTEGGSSQLNDYQVSQFSQELVQTAINSVEYQVGWLPTDTQVPLAVVRVVDKSGGGQEIQIDMTQNTYAFNRPWYSVVDTQHRAQVGSGAVTPTNPHGMSINDLTVPGQVGIFQGLTGQGVVISRDLHRNKMLGAQSCVYAIAYSDIKTDLSGSLTKGSVYNRVGALYCELSVYPSRIGSVYDLTSPALAISAELIPGTNILVFGPNESITSDQALAVHCTSAKALMPPTLITSNLITFDTPGEGEVLVSGGFTYPTLQDPTLSFEGTGPFARKYTAYLLSTGVLQAFPQVLVPAQSALVSPPQSLVPLYPARIAVGLTNTTGNSALSVTVDIMGEVVNDEGSGISGTYSETLTFTPASGFADQVVPSTAYDLPGQILVTQYRYSSVTSISVTTQSAGSNPQIQMWAEIEPGMSTELNDALVIGEVSWNGQAVTKIKDMRRVQTQWTTSRSYLQVSGETELDSIRLFNFMKAGSQLTNASLHLMTEDFEDPRYLDSSRGFFSPTSAKGALGLNSSISLLAGDQITLTTSPSRVLTAVSTTPSAPGQFNVGTPLVPVAISDIRDNIINAINDPAFAANAVAEMSQTNPLNINLTLLAPLGVQANQISLSAQTVNTGAISLSGWNFGVDGFGECYFTRSVVGLDSKVIPPNANLNPYQYAYRNRYRTRALSLPATIGPQQTFAVQVLGEDRYSDISVRIRGSVATNAKVWSAWSVMQAATPGVRGLYTIQFPASVHKVQVEVYGRARGLAVYMVRS